MVKVIIKEMQDKLSILAKIRKLDSAECWGSRYAGSFMKKSISTAVLKNNLAQCRQIKNAYIR